jgi:NAD(P)-dependent dehydrogenase (short-subunit alcohol dehydrogenase family)
MSDPGAILITGCSSGIGEATAMRLAAAGRTVYATARRTESLSELERTGCRTLALDVTDEASARAAVEAIEREHGSVGALVNNAGYAVSGAIEALSDALRFEQRGFASAASLPGDGNRPTAPGDAWHPSRSRVRRVPQDPGQAAEPARLG